ncbi:MAG: DUF4012 domain-containing protein [Candidatus Buchananbacteria bacterium]
MNYQNEFNIGQSQPGIKPKKRKRWLMPIVIFLIVLIVALIVILYPALVNGYQILKRVEVLKSRVEPTMENVKSGKWQEVKTDLTQTKEDLIFIQNGLNNLGLVSRIPSIDKKITAADHLLGASIKLLTGFNEIINIVASVDTNTANINGLANQLGTGANKKGILLAISKNRDAFDKISLSLKEAQDELSLVSSNDLLGKYGEQFKSLYNSLSSIVQDSEMALPILKQLPEILGEGQEKTYLILFENNMEMRATGGFIGSYGILKIKDGEIVSLFTDDIYNLDKLSKEKLNAIAPAPVQAYLKQKYWYMRDANWSPDWPTSAKQLVWFFDSERQIAGLPYQPVDGVIAITPDLIADMLSLVGEVEMYGKKFQSQNFALDLEKFVELDYASHGISTTERKSIIGPMSQIIMDRIEKMPPSGLLNLWTVIKKSIDQKHILIYLADANIQKYFSEQNWAGEIAQNDGDYITVIDSNMAALKTDSVMKKSLAYNLQENSDGSLAAELELTYKHDGAFQKDLVSMYRDYLRVYIPQGSIVKGAKLIDGNKVTELSANDLVIYKELGKTVVGIFMTVNIGKEKKIVLQYELPKTISTQYQNGLYKLFVQKQAGTSGHNLKINLEFKKHIIAYDYLTAPQELQKNSVLWNTNLEQDREFSLKFN